MSRIADTYKSIDANAITAGSPEAAWTPTAGKRFVLLGWSLSVSAAASVIFQDGDTVLFRTHKAAVDTAIESPGDFRYASATKDRALKIDVSANATVSGFVYGYEVEDN